MTIARPPSISLDERRQRLGALRIRMDKAGVGAVLLGSTTSLRYFTGVSWRASERFLGALILPDRIDYIGPGFERTKVESLIGVPGELLTWEEEENPYRLIADRAAGATIALDGDLPLFMYRALRREIADADLADAIPLIAPLRARKSPAEIALLQHAKAITLETQRRARDRLREGVMASEIARYIDETHRTLGGGASTFCIVAFGSDTSLPHGPEADRALKGGDAVLIDTGCEFEGYNSDITRSYVFGEATLKYRAAWDAEKEAQAAAFDAARRGALCESVDAAARRSLERRGFGPGYALPGLPHRTGHGIGLDIHEAPNLVKGDRTPLDIGMCFSNEPMIVVPGEFGVRHEDHFHIAGDGPRWFTRPAASLDDPFADAPAFA
ncbi:MAG: Xaa-Pro peptidase family protein [Parvularculaceae bacterium]|nr:aminopeptidase P family protein [Parvularculaceae bacterium]